MTTETLTELLGWASVINIALLILTTIMVIAVRGTIAKIHSSLFGLDEKDLGSLFSIHRAI